MHRPRHESDLAICMPYFERLGFLQRTMQSFIINGYFNREAKIKAMVSIVDDGSIKEPVNPEEFKGLPVQVARLPEKTEWRNPCVPLNISVKATVAPLLLLQSPEVMHPQPILLPMASRIQTYKDVVLCPVRREHKRKWVAHPTHKPKRFWFCQMMSREFFDEVGGFDEKYRDGEGYEDDDFEKRLTDAGARWIWAEDCLAIHQGDHLKTTKKGTKRNERIFKNGNDSQKA